MSVDPVHYGYAKYTAKGLDPRQPLDNLDRQSVEASR